MLAVCFAVVAPSYCEVHLNVLVREVITRQLERLRDTIPRRAYYNELPVDLKVA